MVTGINTRKTKVKKMFDGKRWPQKKKEEACLAYLETGNLMSAALASSVPWNTIRQWLYEDWWKDLTAFYREQQDANRDSKYSSIMKTALDVVEDRLINGEQILDSKTGSIVTIPVKLRDANRALKDITEQQNLVRKQPTKIVQNKSVDDKLSKLAESFALFAGQVKKALPLKEDLEIEDAEYEVLGEEYTIMNESSIEDAIEERSDEDGE